MTPADARELLRHMEWADGLTWGAVLARPGAGQDAALKERLHHIHTVHWAYLQIWRGEPVRIPELHTFESLAAIQGWARAFYAELPGFLDSLQAADLERPVVFPWAERLVERFGAAGPVTLGQSVQQLAMHSVHHRGQVALQIRALGGEPPLIDYVAWLWMDRPDPAWPAPAAGA